jgi:hypothetical protein
MPRGVYDRSKARPRRRRARTGASSLSKRIELMSKQLAALSEEVKRTEAVQAALAPFMQPVTVTVNGRRRGRPPGSKNRPRTAATAPRRRGRPPGSKNRPKAGNAAPRRRGRPPKSAAT